MAKDLAKERDARITFRKPTPQDGADVNALIEQCKPLDENSVYCNLIQCDHFRDTCVVAESRKDIVGWISAYILPDAEDTIFVWQVAVSEKARGQGLGSRMLNEIVSRPECKNITKMQTTITASNSASWSLFERFADKKDADLTSKAYFKRDEHFNGEAPTEHLVTISLEEALSAAA
ncbi:diaminobutyrate acetyltransferase [Roseovarius aestuariivivens]|uniref:diaminobutyrate acetyltransferase n=1 Tax=Roseovarius aestuariivivens TaxID=1888910 RepID=UPI00107FE262|nr:diaminobutyrate acetyltransferase [Roseovarius aestuariivivens]